MGSAGRGMPVLLIVACALLVAHAAPPRWFMHQHGIASSRAVAGELAAKYHQGCLKELWFDQRLDHFHARNQTTFRARYMLCDRWWKPAGPNGQQQQQQAGPIFFYMGNEGPVELYVNNTGLMWENAEAFGALVVFAEHRYYGRSEPFGPDSWAVDPTYLSLEQALADYANLIWHLKGSLPGASDSPVVAFGGSYGGMLAAWMRIKYPHLVTGAIAASAPIAAYPGVPEFQPSKFWELVTHDASPAAGAAPGCVNNTRSAFNLLLTVTRTDEGRRTASRLLRLCNEIKDEAEAVDVAYWAQGAFDAMAMGNFPYPSAYISGDPEHPLPAWPMRAACQLMTRSTHLYSSDLLSSLADAVGLLYNATGAEACFDPVLSGPAAGNSGPWDWQYCSQQLAQEQPYFPANGVTDMFWDQGPFNWSAIEQHCSEAWDVTPDAHWLAAQYGGLQVLESASNIVLSNGLMDPWSAFGLQTNVSDSVVAVLIPNGAHHVDLMFSHPADTPDIRAARQVELAHIRKWVQQHGQRQRLAARQSSASGGAGGGSKDAKRQAATAAAAAAAGLVF